jgi:Saxitoxin biosynthesis operon protein SxtJ
MVTTAHSIPELNPKRLREFGLVTGSVIGVLFGALFPWWLERAFPMWPWMIFVVLSVWALVAPASLRPIYRVWMRVGLLLSKVTTPIIMGVLFFVVIVPVGFVMRMMNSDPLHRRLDRGLTSYRVESRKAPRENMEKPF